MPAVESIREYRLSRALRKRQFEIALNLAIRAAGEGKRPVHFFDMDQTKAPLPLKVGTDAVMERAVFQFRL